MSDSDSSSFSEEWQGWDTDSDQENWGWCSRCELSKKFCPDKSDRAYWKLEEWKADIKKAKLAKRKRDLTPT